MHAQSHENVVFTHFITSKNVNYLRFCLHRVYCFCIACCYATLFMWEKVDLVLRELYKSNKRAKKCKKTALLLRQRLHAEQGLITNSTVSLSGLVLNGVRKWGILNNVYKCVLI